MRREKKKKKKKKKEEEDEEEEEEEKERSRRTRTITTKEGLAIAIFYFWLIHFHNALPLFAIYDRSYWLNFSIFGPRFSDQLLAIFQKQLNYAHSFASVRIV